MTKLLITVVTLVYNNGELVLSTLEAIKNQTHPNIDHIIVDDCSGDNSVDLIEEWINRNSYQCRFIRNSENIGICKSLNKVLSLARGQYLTLNCDDYWEPFHLERSLDILQRSGADVIFSSTRICKRDGTLLYVLEDMLSMAHYDRLQMLLPAVEPYFIVDKEIAVDALFYLNYLHIITAVVPMEWLRQTGGFDEDLPFEDYDLAFRICSGLKVCFNRSFTATYYKHDKSFTVDPKRIAILNYGSIKTLVKHKGLLTRGATKERFEHTITKCCLQVLEANPTRFFEIVAHYKSALPEKTWYESAIFFLKKLYLMRTNLWEKISARQ